MRKPLALTGAVMTADPKKATPYAHWLALAAVALLPAALTVLLLRTVLGATVFDTTPVINDEIAFWVEIDTFREAGWGGGYHTTNEQTPPAGFCHFDPKGPGYPVLYGSLAKVLGWEPWSGPVFNLLLVTLAVGTWAWAVRPRGWQLAAAALLIGTFWPCPLYLPSTMQESLHCALAFLLAAAMQRSLAEPPDARRFAAVVVLIVAGAMVRLTWGFVLLPWAWVGLRGFSRRGRAAGAAAVCLTLAGLVLLSRWLNAPHLLPEGIGVVAHVVRGLRTAPAEAWSFFEGHARWNLRNLVMPDGGDPLEVLLRYQVMGLLAAAAVLAWLRRRDPDARRPWVFTLLNLGPLLVASVLIYDVAIWRDYRVLAPHLLLSLLLLAGGPAWRWTLAVSASNLAFVTAFLTQFSAHHLDRVRWDREFVAGFRREIRSVLKYDPDRSAWDNTLVIPVQAMTYPMVATPSGIGVNCVLDWSTFRLPARSRYLLMPPEFLPALREHGRLRPLARTRMGVLCLNLDAQPGPPR
jgi:hypothetical protein